MSCRWLYIFSDIYKWKRYQLIYICIYMYMYMYIYMYGLPLSSREILRKIQESWLWPQKWPIAPILGIISIFFLNEKQSYYTTFQCLSSGTISE